MSKKATALGLSLIIILAMPTLANARPLDEVPQRVEHSTAFVPLRLAAYAHGATVEWDGAARLVIITGAHGDVITVSVEGAGGFIDGGTSWIPYEYAARLFDAPTAYEAAWDHEPAEDAEADEAVPLVMAMIAQAIDASHSFVAERSEILSITSTDGYVFQSRLTMPDGDGPVQAIVIDAGTSGPASYLTTIFHESGFGQLNYWDFWAKEFANMGAAFLTSNTRGVSPTLEPPFVEIDDEGYLTYLPSNVLEDIYHMIRTIRENPRLADADIFLTGFSEGAIIAALFAYTNPGAVDALFLSGVPIQNMQHTLRWQASGHGTMMALSAMFETDELWRISEQAFYAGPWEEAFGMAFEDLDSTGDGFLDAEDMVTLFRSLGLPAHLHDADVIIDAIMRGDDDWLMEHYPVRLTAGWFQEHFALRSNMEVLPELDLPIYIFHGTLDANVYVGEVLELQARLLDMGRTNVVINIFPEHNHDLNWEFTAFLGDVPDGIAAILEAVASRLGR